MLTAETAGAHNKILAVAVRFLLATVPKATAFAAFVLCAWLSVPTSAQDWTPLHSAAYDGDDKKAAALLNDGANVNARTTSGATPLYVAARENKFEVVQVLINRGANLNLPGEGGWSPLYAATYNGHLRVIHILLEAGADINARTKQDDTPLHAAVGGTV